MIPMCVPHITFNTRGNATCMMKMWSLVALHALEVTLTEAIDVGGKLAYRDGDQRMISTTIAELTTFKTKAHI